MITKYFYLLFLKITFLARTIKCRLRRNYQFKNYQNLKNSKMLSNKYFHMIESLLSYSAFFMAFPAHWQSSSTPSKGRLVITSNLKHRYTIFVTFIYSYSAYLLIQVIYQKTTGHGNAIPFYFLYAFFLCALFFCVVTLQTYRKMEEIRNYLIGWFQFLWRAQSKLKHVTHTLINLILSTLLINNNMHF